MASLVGKIPTWPHGDKWINNLEYEETVRITRVKRPNCQHLSHISQVQYDPA
jgi:hypothetical protein